MKTIIAILALVLTGSALACSCGPWANGRIMVRNADAAFVGFPRTDSVVVGTEDGETIQRTSFSVLRNFKSSSMSRKSIYSERDTGANCGANFIRMSGVYLIFADRVGGRLMVNACMYSTVDSERSIRAISQIIL